MKFTQEQLDIFAICKNLKNNEKVSIIAPAGSGKTSTLVELAKQLPNKTILYLAYNQSIKKEAQGKFPSNVVVLTTHGLALRSQNIKIEEISTSYLSVVDVQCKYLMIFVTPILENSMKTSLKRMCRCRRLVKYTKK